jgi:serine/threonine protein kinase
LCGTPEYLAPEIILTKGHNKAVDWWALGVVIFEFLAGYPPFHHENTFVIYQQILSKEVKFPPHFSDAARNLISKLLQPEPSKRMRCIADIKSHSFFVFSDFGTLSPPHLFPLPVPPHPLNCSSKAMQRQGGKTRTHSNLCRDD